MKTHAYLPLLAICLFFGGCLATTHYQFYEDGGEIYVGKGGAKEYFNGVEIWSNGSPPRAYRIIGLIQDNRPNGIVHLASFKSDVATAISEHGGQAGIIINQGIKQLGTYTLPGRTTFETTTTTNRNGQTRMRGEVETTPPLILERSDQSTTVAVIVYVDQPKK